jgi:SAM-dependent methyltransferase
MADHEVDGKYYQAARPGSLAERLVIRARAQIYQDFLRLCRPRRDDTILDVGVSDVVGESPNLLERLYPHRDRITALGLGDAEAFHAQFPEVRYRKVAPNEPLPFPDRHFAIATSNAVLEHVGSVENQRRFVAEMMRVARQVFITVPHRFFPVEHHTAIPLLHYLDATFAVACRLLGKAAWAEPSQLILMSRGRLARLWPAPSVSIGFTGLRLGPFSSNLYAHWRHGGDGEPAIG